MSHPGEITRRDLLRRIGLTAVVVGPGAGLLSACATGGGTAASPSASAPAPATSAAFDPKNPFAVDAKKGLEVVIFTGGFKDDYATGLHQPMYTKAHAGATIKHTGTQNVGTMLRPRFLSGEVPDVVNNSGPEAMDVAALAAEGHVAELTALWDAPSFDDPSKKVRDTVTPAALEEGKLNGKDMTLNYVVSQRALWYNAKLFQEKGWTLPTTMEEFKALGDKAKAEGIHLFAYPGQKGPYYMLWNMLYTAAKIGGNKAIIDIDNLVDNAWKSDAMKASVTAWHEIFTKYSDKSYLGLDHTQTQVKHLQNKFLFYPTGSWLEGEMAKDKPETFEYAIAPFPSVTTADAMPYGAIQVGSGEVFFATAKGQNPQGALEYLRIMLSKEGAKGFVEKTGSLTIVNGSADGVELPPGLASAAKATDAAGPNVITSARFEGWYKELFDYAWAQQNILMGGRMTVEEYLDKVQKKADDVKADSSIAKQTRDA
ncbi:N-acetylglucosamine/diacetylchitobiose ABC transporter substrate-binding protein [Nonomuraea soli]|uniref:N-acetylglucosamine transport system substrate-binding protein n=1 Tax=Nonomuraea soli TaxID=1032476 RepID=A0A7W0CM38_9ACTN|nr:N-acetylglucosamine/diacetylchitobiose ABC transporter substrate-binding protein [Nonomuraea soli]MBA2893673.1 N-acetylglucosamine transport system substrate-binding protein [Nonomuraea soli]